MKTCALWPVPAAAALAVLFLAPAGPSLADQKPDWWFKDTVDFAFVEPLVVLPRRDDVMVVDSRPTASMYDKGHIPTAVNIPDTQFSKLTHLLPQNKGMLLVFYCQGVECMKSHVSAADAVKLGYTNVKVYPGGYPDWIEHGKVPAVSTAYVKKLLDEKAPVTLVDARPERVFKAGSVPGALGISDTVFDKNIDLLPKDKSQTLIYFCGGFACPLSDSSAKKAVALGYKDVRTWPAGYPEWKERFESAQAAAQPASAGSAPAAAGGLAIEQGAEKGTVTVASFEKLLKDHADRIYVVDVRSALEVAKGTIKGAVNIPIDTLEKKLDSLPADKPIIFVCATGARSGEAYDMVSMMRGKLDAHFVDATITYAADGSYKIKPNGK